MQCEHSIYFPSIHHDVMAWKRFPAELALCQRNPQGTVKSPKRPVAQCFDIFIAVSLNMMMLNIQSTGLWFDMADCNEIVIL